jgi:CO dehydrogenase maturation factor
MKLAITGKGGVGKSTTAAALALLLAKRNRRVLAVDADPDANLAACLGISPEKQKQIVPIAARRALVEERTGAKARQYGQIFKINPDVSDIANDYAVAHNGVALLVLGAIEGGATGCACPENVLLKSLVAELVLRRDDTLILDMEAGLEHLGRATAQGVDTMLVVVEPGQRSIDSALRIREMAAQIGIPRVVAVANKVMSADDEQFVRCSLDDWNIVGAIPYSEDLRNTDRPGRSVLDGATPVIGAVFAQVLEAFEV